MKVSEAMTEKVTACTSDAAISRVAQSMISEDCGLIPVVEEKGNVIKPVGVITDRDIVVQAIAKGRNPQNLKARDCMTRNLHTVRDTADLSECTSLMEKYQLRRMLVVDQNNSLVGIVAQADVAKRAEASKTAQLVKDVSQSN